MKLFNAGLKARCARQKSITHHGNVVVFSDDLPDPLQLLLQVIGPNLTYLLVVIHSSSGHSAASCTEIDARRKKKKKKKKDSWFIDQPADHGQTKR